MASTPQLARLKRAHTGMRKIIAKRYTATTEAMWDTTLSQLRAILSDDLPDLAAFEQRYARQIEFEQRLPVLSDRDTGISWREMLDQQHEQIEDDLHRALLESLELSVLTVETAEQLVKMAEQRLTYHKLLRKEIRRTVDTAQFHVSDVIAKHERKMPSAEDAIHGTLQYIANNRSSKITP